jgi:hypothetical protein
MFRRLTVALALVATGSTALAGTAHGSSLRGSPASMVEQNQVARQHGLTFFRTESEILGAVMRGQLVELQGNADYAVADFVRFPYLHPAAHLFVERLAAQYHAACGQQLVVTSATRPTTGQPRNAHRLSVHPAGMAVDLRVSDRASCRSWLESALLSMERQGLLNGIRERTPPHYHVAVYPERYMAYAQERMAEEAVARAEAEARAEADAAAERAAAARLAAATALAMTPASRSVTPLIATLALLIAVPLGRRVLRDRRLLPNVRRPGGRRSSDR